MERKTEPWDKLGDRLAERHEPFLGHPLKPIPLRDSKARTERVSTYVELDLLRFLQAYCARGGFRSVSEVLRRLTILGAIEEGYQFDNFDIRERT